MIAQINMRKGTSAEWAAAAPVILLAGESGYDTTLKRYKVGDGETEWDNLEWNTLWSRPVGSIYESTVSTSPATLFGGTWSALPTGRFLRIGTGGATGGSDTHVHTTAAMALTLAQMPVHGHYDGRSNATVGATPGSDSVVVTFSNQTGFKTATEGSGATHGHGDTGSASNVPAYYEVYAWRRTA